MTSHAHTTTSYTAIPANGIALLFCVVLPLFTVVLVIACITGWLLPVFPIDLVCIITAVWYFVKQVQPRPNGIFITSASGQEKVLAEWSNIRQISIVTAPGNTRKMVYKVMKALTGWQLIRIDIAGHKPAVFWCNRASRLMRQMEFIIIG